MTDDLYRAWIQTLPSCLGGKFSEYLEDGRRLCVAAHVRRAGESGIAYKAPYSCVPVTQTEHAYQHNHGELASSANSPVTRSSFAHSITPLLWKHCALPRNGSTRRW